MSLPTAANKPVSSSNWQSTSSIEAAALAYVRGSPPPAGTRTESRVKALDKRLKLARCGVQLEAFVPSSASPSGTQIVGVRCSRPYPWKIFVPISTVTFEEVVVAVRPLMRGSTIGSEDVRLEEKDVTRLRNRYLTDLGQLEGRVLKQDIRAHAILSQTVLGTQDIVQRGQSVTLLARSGKMNVRMRGEVLNNAAKDERVRVKNLSSQRVVEGIVQSRQVVLVNH